MSLSAASKLHKLSVDISVRPIPISHQPFNAFARDLKRFESSLGEHAQDDYWQSRLRKLKRYRFRVCATPLGFDDPDGSFGVLFERLHMSLAQCDRLYPNFSAPALDLVRQAQELTALRENPILNAITDLSTSKLSAVLIKESRFIEPTEILLSKHLSLRHLMVRTPSQLRGDEIYDELVLIGPMRWFPDHIMLAPRTAQIHQIRFDFLGDGWQPQVSLVRPLKKHTFERTSVVPDMPKERESISADEVLPEIDWDVITRSVLGKSAPDEETVDANLVKLAEDNAVFLDISASELVIDTSHRDPIQRVKVGHLNTDLFLITRERGKGAYIVPIANLILKERAEEYRAAQARWKTALRETLKSKGQEFVLGKLRLYGAQSATTGNVRYWSSNSERKIRPRYRKDFAAILTLLDMEDDLDYLWKVAQAIRRAHQYAGRTMKERLLDAVRNASLNELERRGYQEFQIEEYQTNLIAYRIRDISKDTYEVPLRKIGELFHAEDNEWRA